MSDSVKTTVPAVLNGGNTALAAVLASQGISETGIHFRFAKDGQFRKQADDDLIPEGTEFVCPYTQAQAGLIKFNGKGEQPTRYLGNMFDGYIPPKREELGDLDESLWEKDLSGKPRDPWQQQMLLPLQNVETEELYIFS